MAFPKALLTFPAAATHRSGRSHTLDLQCGQFFTHCPYSGSILRVRERVSDSCVLRRRPSLRVRRQWLITPWLEGTCAVCRLPWVVQTRSKIPRHSRGVANGAHRSEYVGLFGKVAEARTPCGHGAMASMIWGHRAI